VLTLQPQPACTLPAVAAESCCCLPAIKAAAGRALRDAQGVLASPPQLWGAALAGELVQELDLALTGGFRQVLVSCFLQHGHYVASKVSLGFTMPQLQPPRQCSLKEFIAFSSPSTADGESVCGAGLHVPPREGPAGHESDPGCVQVHREGAEGYCQVGPCSSTQVQTASYC
jgi:hypothetical protein